MKNLCIMAAIMLVGSLCFGEDKPKENGIDPDAYQAALDKLAAKSATPATQPVTIEQLLAENAALRQRVSELEAILGLKNKPAVQRQVKTFTTTQEMINSVKYPADPKKPWTEIQLERAQHDIQAAIIGCNFEATGTLKSATVEKPRPRSVPPLPARGFHCIFSRPGGEDVSAFFDVRYSDLITSWKVGQSVSFVGVISTASIRQVKRAGAIQLELSFDVSDCVPKK